jgi:hypothetical protein
MDDGVHTAGEKARCHLESYLETVGEHPIKRKSKVFVNLCAKLPIFIRAGELIMGRPTSYNRGAYPNHSLV